MGMKELKVGTVSGIRGKTLPKTSPRVSPKRRQKCQAPMGMKELKVGTVSGIRGKTLPRVSPKVPGTNGDGATIRYQELG